MKGGHYYMEFVDEKKSYKKLKLKMKKEVVKA